MAQKPTELNASWRHQQSFPYVRLSWCADRVHEDPSSVGAPGDSCHSTNWAIVIKRPSQRHRQTKTNVPVFLSFGGVG